MIIVKYKVLGFGCIVVFNISVVEVVLFEDVLRVEMYVLIVEFE